MTIKKKKKYDNKAEILTFFKSHSFKNQKNNYFLFKKKKKKVANMCILYYTS